MEAPEFTHIPVLLEEVLSYVEEDQAQAIVVDGTFGRGGHAREILKKMKPKSYLALDKDPRAIEEAKLLQKEYGEKGTEIGVYHSSFIHIPKVMEKAQIKTADFILLDLGVSSPQLDEGERGFSFNKPGPLDMRMDTSKGQTAADIVNKMPEKELADIIYLYGEERASRKIARAIVQQRAISPINHTLQLADLIESVMPRSGKNHPATRSFQALRIAVNGELDELENILNSLPGCLSEGGVVALISFHSLEDRAVKVMYKKWASEGLGKILTKKCISAGDYEARNNRRSRSAKLRVFRRGK
ncbi:MAG: 16S rRNA (cytosine(1402)-N(4))-methyltransferase RsmH [Planctomycetes bacterium]|nr:16S rRNA (cytosine(1402)-N(4))-methyltransferase RsmH [Planctomycetota bacterium]